MLSFHHDSFPLSLHGLNTRAIQCVKDDSHLVPTLFYGMFRKVTVIAVSLIFLTLFSFFLFAQ